MACFVLFIFYRLCPCGECNCVILLVDHPGRTFGGLCKYCLTGENGDIVVWWLLLDHICGVGKDGCIVSVYFSFI